MTIVTLPNGATLRPLELPARADAGPTPLVRRYAEVRNTVIRQVTGRDDDVVPAESLLPLLRSDADVVRRQWYIERGGELIGCAPLNIPQDDGDTIATGTIALLREHWSRGIGSAVLNVLEEHARAAGAQRMLCWEEHHGDDGTQMLRSPTGVGAVPRDHAARFLDRHGFRLEQVERASELALDAAADQRISALHDAALRHAAEYRTVQWMLPTPPEHLDDYAWLKSRMSTDVPDGQLGMPVEVWDAERVRRHDERYLRRGAAVLVTAAEHIATRRLVAFTELAMFGDDDTAKGDQQDTLVLAEHRGHRLGTLVKTAALQSWRRRYPHSPRVVTYNAEDNRPMLSINEALGFTPVAHEGAWRKDLL
ncbi:GNAT family N-acetyltransferase [Microbacterium sp. USHLN186]|uniref:GNAT family N-acetyltransferase n=1 Tax=Microbacterium sp. USHLN186 TaxID=3081286 RepID=UPI0030169C8E